MNGFIQNQRRFFAAENDAAKPSEEELKNAREEWGFKYDDEAFRFEKEWKAIADKIETEYVLKLLTVLMTYLGRECTSRVNFQTCRRRKSRC